MSSQDRLENVLRDIHVMISKSETYDTDRIIVSKKDMFGLIDRLNASIYEIMDEYELTQQSRDRALRENKKEGDKIIWDASRQAEDIYAASVMYTEEALNHLHKMVEEANGTIGGLYKDFQKNMKKQQETIRENQLELKSQLQLLADTEKYLTLIEDRNKEIARERAESEGKKVVEKAAAHNAFKPEIKINEDYFRRAGIPIEGDTKEQAQEDIMEPLADEGIITSTLKRVAMDAQKEKEDKNNVETNEGGQNNQNQTLSSNGLEKSQESSDSDEQTAIGAVSDSSGIFNADDTSDNYEISAGTEEQPAESVQTDKAAAIEDSIKVNLDAEYFKWKSEAENSEEEPHHEKHSLLEKLMGKKKSSD